MFTAKNSNNKKREEAKKIKMSIIKHKVKVKLLLAKLIILPRKFLPILNWRKMSR
jgi:hypothetical protein